MLVSAGQNIQANFNGFSLWKGHRINILTPKDNQKKNNFGLLLRTDV